MIAFINPLRLLPLRLVKKLTVIGIMGNTHGVSKAANPPRKPARKITHKDLLLFFGASTIGCADFTSVTTILFDVESGTVTNITAKLY